MAAIEKARKILESVTPLAGDCGRVCSAACCSPDSDGQGGMLLFPGEERYYSSGTNGFLITKDSAVVPGGLLLTCRGCCERDNRPLGCRMFPLLPKEKDGVVRAVRDRRGYVVCPLLESGLSAFSPAFTAAVVKAGEILYQDPIQHAFLDALHAFIRTLRDWP